MERKLAWGYSVFSGDALRSELWNYTLYRSLLNTIYFYNISIPLPQAYDFSKKLLTKKSIKTCILNKIGDNDEVATATVKEIEHQQ